jgi:hypothetical protein
MKFKRKFDDAYRPLLIAARQLFRTLEWDYSEGMFSCQCFSTHFTLTRVSSRKLVLSLDDGPDETFATALRAIYWLKRTDQKATDDSDVFDLIISNIRRRI